MCFNTKIPFETLFVYSLFMESIGIYEAISSSKLGAHTDWIQFQPIVPLFQLLLLAICGCLAKSDCLA